MVNGAQEKEACRERWSRSGQGDAGPAPQPGPVCSGAWCPALWLQACPTTAVGREMIGEMGSRDVGVGEREYETLSGTVDIRVLASTVDRWRHVCLCPSV